MEVVLSVPDAELEDFPEEATESWMDTYIILPADLLERIRQGRLSYLDLNGITPKAKGGSTKYKITRRHSSQQAHQFQAYS